MKLAIMQPYLFPYIGYYQLVNAVDKFILYDDVGYIKSGWINRNNILINGEKKLFTVSLQDASSNKHINQIKVGQNTEKELRKIQVSYSKAPFFKQVYPICEDVFSQATEQTLISEIAGLSVIKVAQYLELNTVFEYSSTHYSDTMGLERAERLITICKRNNARTYINAIGGKELYTKEQFAEHQIDLFFINSKVDSYKQFKNEFVPFLSIIDILMFNSASDVRRMLENYTLE